VPDVSLALVHWDELTLGQARATLALDVRNTNSFAIELEDLSLGVSLGGTHVADASAVPLDSLAGGESARVNIPISFSPMSLGTAALSLFKGEASSYGLDGLLSLGTPFGPLATPVTRTGTVPFLR
jgi:LEA14-like dessication related protein